MGNTFKSLVAAAGILAAGDATNAQEGADSTANKTKQALVELLSELPPGFDSARKVIEGDITLAGDGDLSDSDKLAIEGHMGKLATVIPGSARKVREAMSGVETIVAADQVAALNESPEDEKLRKEEERKNKIRISLMESFVKAVNEEENWKKGPQGNEEVSIEGRNKTLNITYKGRTTGDDLANKTGVAVFNGKLLNGDYIFDIQANSKTILWLLDSSGKCLDMDGNNAAKGRERILLDNGPQTIRIPENCSEITIGFSVNPIQPEIQVNEINVQIVKNT